MRLLLLFTLLSTSLLFSSNNKIDSKLNDVTIYLNGAQISRNTEIIVPIGTTEYTFSNLSPNIQESSIQISGLQQASLLSINYGINYLDKRQNTEEITTLKAQIESLKDKISIQDNLILGYKEELSLIQANKRLGNETENVNLEKVKAFALYYRTRLTEVKNEIHKAEKKKTAYNNDINDINLQLKELNVTEKVQTGEITIKLNSEVATKLNLTLKYNVTEAGWFPVYDLKAKTINKPLNLTYKAHVYQNTGQDWNDIKVTLSTSDPHTNNIKPDLNPKYLNFISRYSNYKSNTASKNYNYKYNPYIKTVSGTVTDESGLPLPGASVIVKGTTNGVSTDFDGNYSIKINQGDALEFSYVGYKSETLPIHSSMINVSMSLDNQLDEVVVTAYSTSNIKIRGASSVTNYNPPLYIVDGIPVSENEFHNIPENQIDNIEMLKDAAATAIYGNRGNNGVVIITTKQESYTSTGDIIEEGITNTQFEIQKKHSIPSNGDLTVIKINDFNVPAGFSYYAAPIINENVFLTAKFGNWSQYNLLPGEANIYFEGAYAGKTNINPQSTKDSLTVSLGVDPNVVVKRKKLDNFKSKQFLGNNRIINKAYEIEVKNNKQTDIVLVLMDRIPKSENKEIKVDDIITGNAKYNDKTGLLEWNINLSTNTNKKYSFSYLLKYPKYKRINL